MDLPHGRWPSRLEFFVRKEKLAVAKILEEEKVKQEKLEVSNSWRDAIFYPWFKHIKKPIHALGYLTLHRKKLPHFMWQKLFGIFWCSLGTSPELRFDHLAGDLCLGILVGGHCNKAWDMPSLTANSMGSKASPYEHQDHSRRRMNSVPWKFCTILDQDFVVCFRCLQSEFVCPCPLEAFTTHHTATCCHGPSRSQLKSTCVKRV